MWFDCVEQRRRAGLLASASAPRAVAAVPSFQACLRACIFTFCVCVCIYVYVCMCADMYICIYIVCICLRMHMCVSIYICAFFCIECCMHFGKGVLGTSAWAGVYVTQMCFLRHRTHL